MKSCGVIVEYNPFHNGHRYHLEQARLKSQADVIVAVMSGHFLQRGEPAILDKWQRAKSALANGADVVIELPIAYSVQSADYFARGGVKLLHGLGVTSLCFGTDSKESVDYQAFANFTRTHQSLIDAEYAKQKNNGLSYPQQMTTVYRNVMPEWQLDFSSPNHILGMGYAKETNKYDVPLTLFPIQRESAHHHEEDIITKEYASGTAIRKGSLTTDWGKVEKVVPETTLLALKSGPLVSWESAWPYLKYQLLTMSQEDLREIYQMVEGIEYRLKEMALGANSFDEFVQRVKTKRFTWTRIQRLCTYILLKVTPEQIEEVWDNSYLRVLGFTDSGRKFLKQQKKHLTFPIITNVNRENSKLLTLDNKAGQVYQFLSMAPAPLDFGRKPIIFSEKNS